MIKQKNKSNFLMISLVIVFMAFNIGICFAQATATFYKLIDASQLAIDQRIEHFLFMPDNKTLFGFSTNARMYYILNKSVTVN